MNRGDYTFREASADDFEGVEQLLETQTRRRGWATWKYLRNPDGIARVFVAEDRAKAVVGSLAHVPRRFTSAHTGTLSVLQVVDVFVRADLRQSAVFLSLLQYARQRMDAPRIGFPNSASRVFGAGLGWRVLAPYEDWQFPVSIGRVLAQKRLASIAPIADAFASAYTFAWLPRFGDIEMKRIDRFERDYALDSTVIHGVRSADYLNWRFVQNPMNVYHAYEFVERGMPIGYCVYARVRGCVVLSDFVALRRRRSCARLLVDHCRRMPVDRIRFSGSGLKLGSLGFLRRRRSDRNCIGTQTPEGRWLVTSCDLDSEPDAAQ